LQRNRIADSVLVEWRQFIRAINGRADNLNAFEKKINLVGAGRRDRARQGNIRAARLREWRDRFDKSLPLPAPK
jgi:hypothetical protein